MTDPQSSLAPHFVPKTASSFARVGLAVYTLLIVYASWYPFSGWLDIGVAPFAYLTAPLPHYWTIFDVVTNIIGYLPFGLLFVFACYPRVPRIAAMLLAIVCGSLLSGVMEAVQTFLASRVASNLDLITNAAGTCLGAIAGLFLSHAFLEQSRLLQLRQQWFSHEASRGLIVLGLWPLAQIYPQAYLFGHGQLIPILSDWLSDFLSMSIDLGTLLRQGAQLTTEQYWLAETIITACGLTGALLTLLCLLRKHAPKWPLLLIFLGTALLFKTFANALIFAPENAFAWFTPGAQGGLLVAAVMLSGLVFAPPIAQRRCAALALAISFIAVNMVPANPYFVATLQTWIQGKFLNFNGATQFLSLIWPLFALWFLWHPVHRLKRK